MEYSNFHNAFDNLIKNLSTQSNSEPVKRFISELKIFLEQLDGDDQGDIKLILNDFETQTQEPLFQEIGKVLRGFHDQLISIKDGIPANLGKIANLELEDVSGKLNHILTMTDNAANKTMDLSESIIDDINKQSESNKKFLDKLKSLSNTDDKTCNEMIKEVETHLTNEAVIIKNQQNKLTEILIAQDYQDLTGQVIHKILKLLGSLEGDLTNLIKKFGKQTKAVEEEPEIALKGPLEDGHVEKSSQDDVNNLLSQFGF